VPSQFDWRDENIVSNVKNQGHCGSCWTFSTTGALESHIALFKKKALRAQNRTEESERIFVEELSEQNLIDCAQAFNNNGCDGGLPSQAFEFVRYNNIDQEWEYLYEGVDGKCRSSNSTKKQAALQTLGSHNITQGNEDQIQNVMLEMGPVSVAFCVSGDFQHYSNGVYTSDNCPDTSQDVNHAVLAVGYGTYGKTAYWSVKNSWGRSWGEDGYFRIERGRNMCGISQCAAAPIFK